MSQPGTGPYAYNRTRDKYLATHLTIAASHWSRLRGLMFTDAESFRTGDGLWIVPSRGVHTFAMRFPIDVVYLDSGRIVIHVENRLKPWRMAPVRMKAASVVELPGGTIESTGTALGDAIEIVTQSMKGNE